MWINTCGYRKGYDSLLAQQSTAVTGAIAHPCSLTYRVTVAHHRSISHDATAFPDPENFAPRDELNPAGAFVPITSLSHLALTGGQLSDRVSDIGLTDKSVFVQDSI